MDSFTKQICAALTPLADPTKAAGMSAYMKGQFVFLGVPTPARRQATRAAMRAYAGDVPGAAHRLWRQAEREYQYVACDLLAHHAASLPGSALDEVLALVAVKSWWDTVDALAHVVGTLVRRDRSWVARMDVLVDSPDFWCRRVALLHQLGWKEATDTGRLFAYCLRRAHEKEFFIRKAIGWALRDYAWHDPQAVRDFLQRHGTALSPLSRREAGKNLDGS